MHVSNYAVPFNLLSITINLVIIEAARCVSALIGGLGLELLLVHSGCNGLEVLAIYSKHLVLVWAVAWIGGLHGLALSLLHSAIVVVDTVLG